MRESVSSTASRSRSKANTTTSNVAGAASTASNSANAEAFIRERLAAYASEFAERERALPGTSDPEAIHRARVAIRRLRSVLRSFRDALDTQWVDRLRDRLRRASDELSAARDTDIAVERARRDIAEVDEAARARAGGVLAALEVRRSAAYRRVSERTRDPGYETSLRELVRTIENPPFRHAIESARALAKPVLTKAYRRLRKRVRRCGEHPSDEALHAIRIAAKHLRYAAEAFEPFFGRSMSRIARDVGRLQDVLGEEHDAAVVARELQELGNDRELAFAAGELAMVERRAGARARERWRKRFRRVEHTFPKESPASGDG